MVHVRIKFAGSFDRNTHNEIYELDASNADTVKHWVEIRETRQGSRY